MPIEIMELRVKASVCGQDQPAAGREGAGSAAGAAGANAALRETEREVIIQQAVEQVLAILRQEKER